MRTLTHDVPVNFRANEALVAKAAQAASERHMSLSELMRHAMRREVTETEAT